MKQSEDPQYAGFWIRLGATAIDVVLLLVVTWPLLWWIYGLEYFQSQSVIRGPMDFLISWVLPAVAVVVFWKCKSATPGKMLVSAKIVDATTGGKPSTVQLIVRYFAYVVSMLPFGGFILIAVDQRKQALHDKLAGTVVVRENGRGRAKPQAAAD